MALALICQLNGVLVVVSVIKSLSITTEVHRKLRARLLVQQASNLFAIPSAIIAEDLRSGCRRDGRRLVGPLHVSARCLGLERLDLDEVKTVDGRTGKDGIRHDGRTALRNTDVDIGM